LVFGTFDYKSGLGQGLPRLTRFSYFLYILNIPSILSKKWDFLYYSIIMGNPRSQKGAEDTPWRNLSPFAVIFQILVININRLSESEAFHQFNTSHDEDD
jgi:hypothetical protein